MPAMASTQGNSGKKLLALDLDETLVHSSFQVSLAYNTYQAIFCFSFDIYQFNFSQPVEKSSFTISVSIEGVVHSVYVIKRPGTALLSFCFSRVRNRGLRIILRLLFIYCPGCDEFMRRLAEHYEVK